MEAALEYVRRQPSNVCVQLNIEGDDWQSVKEEEFVDLCEELFDALRHPEGSAPHYFTPRETAYFDVNHQKQYRAVLREMKTVEQITLAKARVMLAIDEIIAVHEVGIPKTVLARTEEKTHRGYLPETELKCEDRARQVISYVRWNKYVALDILKGSNIGDLARSPSLYRGRKLDNVQTMQRGALISR